MNGQNILNFYGSKVDVKLDNSEYYDYQLSKVYNDFDISLLDFNNDIIYPSLVFSGASIMEKTENPNQIQQRTEKGWTLDFIFNRDGHPWVSGCTFYYLGVPDEVELNSFVDNNLSFSFTNDGRLKWETVRYSGYTDCVSGFTNHYYLSSGQTTLLPITGDTENFNITIVFERNNYYYGEELSHEGGIANLIVGDSVLNPYDVLTGATEICNTGETLNEIWFNSQFKRMGKLKIYVNGRIFSIFNDWIEIIPSNRGVLPFVQYFNGGTTASGNVHYLDCHFTMVSVKYFEEPLNFSQIKHNFNRNTINHNLIDNTNSINACVDQNLISFVTNSIVTELNELLITENEDIIIY